MASKVQAKLLRQLHRVISETSDLISTWKREASLETRLQVCFVGSVGAFMERAGKDSWAAQLVLPLILDTMRIVVSELSLTEIAEYKRVLKDFRGPTSFV
ncbi:hypothetical protein LTR66_001330 [Elasticomyces elasticus]|nr:hypothetical protein LTR66_001330 [Elasticomyces elasticus]